MAHNYRTKSTACKNSLPTQHLKKNKIFSNLPNCFQRLKVGFQTLSHCYPFDFNQTDNNGKLPRTVTVEPLIWVQLNIVLHPMLDGCCSWTSLSFLLRTPNNIYRRKHTFEIYRKLNWGPFRHYWKMLSAATAPYDCYRKVGFIPRVFRGLKTIRYLRRMFGKSMQLKGLYFQWRFGFCTSF